MTILERLKSSLEKCCDLHFECRKWGDGSSEEGVTNIVCDDLGIVIASDVEEAIAELFVALNNNAPALLDVVEGSKDYLTTLKALTPIPDEQIAQAVKILNEKAKILSNNIAKLEAPDA